MPASENFNTHDFSQLVDPAVATGTVTSSSVDLANYDAATIHVLYGESADTLSGSVLWTSKLQESSDNSTFTDVAAGEVVTNETTAANSFGLVNAAADDDAVYSLGYKGTERYIRSVTTATGTHTNGTPIGVGAVLTVKRQRPTALVVNP